MQEKLKNTKSFVIPELLKNKIQTGLQQLKEGKGIPIKKVMVALAKKYDLSLAIKSPKAK